MATLKLENINKIYDNNIQAVHNFNLEINDKEFIVFVGPSGCGKSTTLRMIAGLEEITSGNLYIDGTLVNTMMAKDRDIAMVFQNYALYPHMTIYKNMSFGLEIRKIPKPVLDKDGHEIKVIDKKRIKYLLNNIKEWKRQDENNEKKKYDNQIAEAEEEIKFLNTNKTAIKVKYIHMSKDEIDKRVKEAAEILGLTQYLKRKPGELSGGQRQRVALGRAIVRHPKVFLMDEPLSNLDAKLRVQTRKEIIKIHQAVNAITIYVTHDQTEAMTMADKIVIMKDGFIKQIGTPKEVYNNPNNMFVAGFIGSPSMNFFKGIMNDNTFIFNGDDKVSVQLKNVPTNYNNKEVILGVRPESAYIKGDLTNKKLTDYSIKITCTLVEILGNEQLVYGEISGQTFYSKVSSDINVIVGNTYEFAFDMDKMYLFDIDTEERIK